MRSSLVFVELSLEFVEPDEREENGPYLFSTTLPFAIPSIKSSRILLQVALGYHGSFLVYFPSPSWGSLFYLF